MNGAANASQFWASKNATRKLTIASSPPTSETPKGTIPATAMTKSLVLKGKPAAATEAALPPDRSATTANGTSNISRTKKTDWADSDDDEEFIASFSTKKHPQPTVLEKEMAQKDTIIEGLKAGIDSHYLHVQQLQNTVAENGHRISELQANVADEAIRAEKMEAENHAQHLYIQELVAQLDEKIRHIQDLEKELDVNGTHIHELGVDSVPKSPTHAAIEIMDNFAARHATSDDMEEADKSVPAFTPVESSEATLETPAMTSPEPSTEDAGKSTAPTKEKMGPAINDSKHPVLWSPDKPKKMVPPVEKPKTLVMAIDMSKYGKKLAPTVSKMKEPFSANGSSTPNFGRASRRLAKTDVVPTFKVDKDIRQMPHAERVLYANGPEVSVVMGDKELATLPKYVLMQCSSKAHKHFSEHPDAISLVFPADCMDADSAILHLRWMDEMTYQGRVYSITFKGDEKFDLHNLKICQAARVMGLNNTYVGHFTKAMCDRIRSNSSSVEFLSAICELAYPENDPIFECLANNLVNQQGSKAFSRVQDKDMLLDKYPALKEKMAAITARVKNSRAADKRKTGASQSASNSRNAGKAEGVEMKLGTILSI